MDPAYKQEGTILPKPTAFRYQGQVIRIAQVLEQWLEAGRRWEQEPECVAWRVMDARGGVYELEMQRVTPPAWQLRAIYD
jgi:hypothetical protein